jgi:CDP-2,3-bis-(O-geranylgeranyl)-sn-glycerol synthase
MGIKMWLFLVKAIYLFIPAALANMMPVVVRKHFKFLEVSVDFGAKFRGKRVFGDHKTLRGFVFGILAAIIIVGLQTYLHRFEFFQKISFINYSEYNFLLLGFLIGFGVLFGDAVESFFKRQRGIAPGKSWMPWDQLDLVIGGIVFISLYWLPPWELVVFTIIAAPLLHIGINLAGYYLGIKKNKL